MTEKPEKRAGGHSMKKKLIIGLLILVLIVVPLSIAACEEELTPTPPGEGEEVGPPAEEQQYGGVLKIITMTSFGNLGLPGSTTFLMWDWIYSRPAIEALFTYDNEGKLTPHLATDWQVSSDFKTIAITLRQGVIFHDGTPFNAAAAKYCLDMVRESTRPELKVVTSIDVIDDYNIRLNLSGPTYPDALLNNIACVHMVSPTALQAMTPEEAMLHPVGTGPFKFVSYQRDVSLKYEKFDDYWQDGKPYLDGVEIIFISTKATMIASFNAGEAQAITRISTSDLAQINPPGGYSLNAQRGSMTGLAPDSANPSSPFADIRVRQAVCYAINLEELAGMFPECEPTNQFALEGNYGYNPTVIGYPYDPQKARDLLAEAGYSTGFETTVTYAAGAAMDEATLVAVQNYLDEVKIHLNINPVDGAVYGQKRAEGWDDGLVLFGISITPTSDLWSLLDVYLSSHSTRYVSVDIPSDYDAKLAQAGAELENSRRQELLMELVPMIFDKYCMIFPFYVNPTLAAFIPSVHDFDMLTPFVSAYKEWHPENTWLSK
jgi:peptide/nickel transport system substrate-binding protein